MTDDNKGSDVFDMLDRVVSFYEKNKETFQGVVDTGTDVTIDDEDPLKQALVTDGKALITVDVGTDAIQDIRLALNGTTAEIGIGDKTIKVDVPADVNMDEAEAKLNNGVLEVTIPRVGGGE